MIPNIKKRAVDWCNECCFYSDDNYGGPKCALMKDYFHERRKCWPVCNIPCSSHFTDTEIRELIDEHNKRNKK